MNRFIPTCIILLVFTVGQIEARAAFKHSAVGTRSPDFVLFSPDGFPMGLSETLGERATVVVFWATWNPRSLDALRDLQQLHARFAADGLEVVSVNVDGEGGGEERRTAVSTVVQDLGLGYPVLVDEDLSVYATYGVMAVPSMVLVGPGGVVSDVQSGYASSSRAKFHRKVLTALGVLTPAPTGEAATNTAYTPSGAAERYLRMGRLFQEKGRTEDAIRYFTRAVAEDPFYPEACQALATVLQRVGRLDEAVRVLAQVDSLQVR